LLALPVSSYLKKKRWKDTFDFISNLTFGQTEGIIRLDKKDTSKWEIQNFDSAKHTFENCLKIELKYLYKIDNQEWFGSDNVIEFPKNELTTLNLKTGTQN